MSAPFHLPRFAVFRRPGWAPAVGRLGAIAGLFATVAFAAENPPGLTQRPLAARPVLAGPMFVEIPPEQSGVIATNHYADPRMWGDLNHEFEIGGIGTGVAIGDYDGDGRPDIFVVSKTESCRLFRNLGDGHFADVTDEAGVADVGAAAAVWKQGATFVDLNNDGLLDLYVCRFNAPNRLYVNQGHGKFKEMAHASGLDVVDGCVMAAFCDYDRDGWLDVFIQTNLLDYNRHPAGQRNYLFHNNRDGTFTDVTARAGITGEAQGHSATWWDFDGDGWPDLYVANDFSPPDQLYHNNHDGTFTNVIDAVVPHLPFSAMGADLGDVNNDGLIDLFVAEMAATTHERDQRGMAGVRSLAREPADGSGAAPQVYHNVLYLNSGTGRMREAAFLAGVPATDWTWSARLADLDNDGRLDLFVTNGMDREEANRDLLARQLRAETPADRVRVFHDSPVLTQTHLAYRNRGDLEFEEVGAAWGLDRKDVGFGAAFGDLFGTGNLDLVYTRYQAGPVLLRNGNTSGHRIMIDLRGTVSNRFGVGATVRLETAAGPQVQMLVLARGYLSSSEPALHFGLGAETAIRRLSVSWPSGREQEFFNLPVDQRFTIVEPSGPVPAPAPPAPTRTWLTDVSGESGLDVVSREDPADEVSGQPLLPVRLNRRGPALAIGDVDGDGIDDVVIGGTTRVPAQIRHGLVSGKFSRLDTAALLPAGAVNDGPVLLFDADGSGRNSLLIAKGGAVLPNGSPEYQPRLYLRAADGRWHPAADDALPPLAISAGAAAVADFDRDGQLDVFLGGRVLPGEYPVPARSALLRNRHGRFEDVTDELAPGLREAGLVTSALWCDVDRDGWPDLLLTLEWGAVKCFHNRSGHGFEDWSDQLGFSSARRGWWTSMAAADFNGDGRPDFVLGNTGLNTQYRASPAHPALLFRGDFKGTGEEPQLVEAYYEGDRLFPWRSSKDLGAVIPSIAKRFPRNDVFSRATLAEVVGEGPLAAAQKFAAEELRSGVLLSQPDGTWRFEPLPRLAQIAPLQGIVAADFDGDGCVDLAVVQNSFAPIPVVGRFDGGLGQLLRGDGHGHFACVPPDVSGFIVPGDAKALAVGDWSDDGWPVLIATRNNDSALVFKIAPAPGRHSLAVRLQGPAGNPTSIGARIAVEFSDGTVQTREIGAGSGYLSQSTPTAFFGYPDSRVPKKVEVMWPTGTLSEEEVPAGAARLQIRIRN